MNSLKGKKILLFAPAVFGYQFEIANTLKTLGAEVDYYDERPRNNFIVKASIRIDKRIIKKKIISYYHNILQKTALKSYDFVFVVNLEAMLPEILLELKTQQSNARFILYMWDSLQNKKTASSVFSLFDKTFSFDKNDAINIEGVKFRPLFFSEQFDSGKHHFPNNCNTDICFIGTVHSDRFNLIREIKHQSEKRGMRTFFYMYFPSRALFWYKKIKDIRFYRAKYGEFHFKPMPLNEIINHISNSKILLDIQHPNQTGLTMRTIESLGADRKLITTNVHVKDYDFYDPQNILVINRNNPVLDEEFLNGSYKTIDRAIKYRYSIEAWAKEIFELND